MLNLYASKSLHKGAAALILSTALVMGGCSKKDKGGAPTISAEKAPLGLSGLSDKDLARHFAVPSRDIDAAQSSKALAALGLSESNANGLSWESRSGDNGNYVFTNLSSVQNNDMITIDRAEIFGVRMDAENAMFDRADFSNLKIAGDDVNVKIAAMSLARPTPDTAKALVQSIRDLTDDTSLDLDDDAKFGFGGLSMKSIDLMADEVTGTIDLLVWGKEDGSDRADFKLENVEMLLPDQSEDIKSILTLKNISARGFDMSSAMNGFENGASGKAPDLSTLLAGFNLFEKPYDNLKLESLKFDSTAMNFDLSKIEGEAKTKGDIITITQVMSPTTLKFNDIGNGPTRQAYETLQQLGFDTMTFKSSQTTLLDKASGTMETNDGILDMADGFRLNYTYSASGLEALENAKADASGNETAKLNNIFENLKLNGMTISLEDKSIVERGLKLAAQMRGGEVKQIKREMRAGLTLAPLLAQSDVEKAVYGELGGAFMDFIDEGGTLTVKLSPATPISAAQMQNLKNLSQDDIGFTARHDK